MRDNHPRPILDILAGCASQLACFVLIALALMACIFVPLVAVALGQ